MGRRGRGGGGPERGRDRPESGADRRAGGDHQDGETGYKGRVHESLERHLKGGDT